MQKLGILAIGVSCLIVAAGALSVLYSQESGEDESVTKAQVRFADESNATAGSVNTLVDSLNDFSFEFYNKLLEGDDGNIFFSPYSIFVALSMAYEGAAGNTADEMQNILNILQNDSVTQSSFGRIYNLLNQNQNGYTIIVKDLNIFIIP